MLWFSMSLVIGVCFYAVLTFVRQYLSLVTRKPAFCIFENKDADQLRSTAQLISAFVFATQIVQSLYYLNPKLQASSHLLWLYSPICVGPDRKPRRPVFSQRGSFISARYMSLNSTSWERAYHF